MYAAILPYFCMAWCLIKHKENLLYFKNIMWEAQVMKQMITVGTPALYLDLYPGFVFSLQAGSTGC
jgi:hypothetical protein